MRSFILNINKSQTGISLLESLVALGIISVIAVVFLGGLQTSLNATITGKEQAIAQSLARSELDYIKSVDYDSAGYSVSPHIDLPEGWSIPTPLVEQVAGTGGGLQKISVTPEHNGVPVLTISTYKMYR